MPVILGRDIDPNLFATLTQAQKNRILGNGLFTKHVTHLAFHVCGRLCRA
jgi:hypothetical protein